ncbi:IMV protein [Staphylococcus phage APTC_SA_12]|nr:MAG: hypothetical protein [Staphylococcus phage RP2]UPO38584.1 hypothetical protein [Staphylococcus phage vB_SaS_GE1]UWV20013.1 IMV protein [Staphylococcus phage APTC_SA_2]UWV20113.1 IMV protein [Staphylococcus phage APTC_SA_4]UWV20527.1 IMV protein [Staphylococcus phage APTC_SA_12]UWV20597.1 IMV protein [Staphylococcus phage APTC_SA_13]WMT38718.1 hypothetical protein [Staphylococcus phage Sp2021]WPH67198.1 hypothetical protein CUBM_gp39 [Staphylococcus phage CUB-M]
MICYTFIILQVFVFVNNFLKLFLVVNKKKYLTPIT